LHRLAHYTSTGFECTAIGLIHRKDHSMFSAKFKVALLGLISASANITISGCASTEKEVSITIEDVPAQVRATIEREAAGGVIEDIELETGKDGLVVYSADTRIAGKVYDIEVAEDGRLISRELD
jgi:hypothetical protein